jgi:hypothetical protein
MPTNPRSNGGGRPPPPKTANQQTSPPPLRRRVDTGGLDLRRNRPEREEEPEPEPTAVSAGPVDKVIELAFNPTREKIREVTIIDRLQGRLFPIMDAMNALYRNCIEISMYRQSPEGYRTVYKKEKPAPVDIMDEMMFRVAQWQKSVQGKNLEKATDIALAETETRGGEGEEPIAGGRGYEE